MAPSPTPTLAATLAPTPSETAPSETSVAATDTLTPTSTPLLAIIPSATHTLLPTDAPTPAPASVEELPPSALAPAGRIALLHPEAPDYVFIIDPALWQVDQQPGNSLSFLRHTQIQDCRIDIVQPSSPDQPGRIYSFILGRRNWLVYDYRVHAYLGQPQMVLDLQNYLDTGCRRDQLAVLAAVLSWDEYNGAPTSTQVYPPTPRPPLAEFTCPGASVPRLRTGDQAIITADALWLRAEPNQDEAKKMTLYPQFAPVTIDVLEGPTCHAEYIYWKVRVTEVKEGGSTITGWLAESHGSDYYLAPWNLGW